MFRVRSPLVQFAPFRGHAPRYARRARAILLAALFVAAAPGAALADTRSTNDGVYTADQAARGAKAHVDYCAKCHHQSYYSAGFLDPWYGASLESLYELVRMKMPEDRPGALRPREYAALLAWVLELNGYPAGAEPLGFDLEALRAVRIERPAP